MARELRWPAMGGCSLMLVLLGEGPVDSSSVLRSLRQVSDEFGVDVGRGVENCDGLVRSGISSLSWLKSDQVFVFRCPRDFAVWEAAPLVERSLPHDLAAAAVDFFIRCGECALSTSKRIAFVVAHNWKPDDRVRYESGSMADFASFLRSFGAWSTQYLGLGCEYVVNGDTETPFWYEVRE